jgi:hypothetical protein
MLNHSRSVSEQEEELGFSIRALPSTDGPARWKGKFARICAKQICPSSYVMKFEEESGTTYCHFRWGTPEGFHGPPNWISIGRAFTEPELAIHSAELDMSDCLNVAPHSMPEQGNPDTV